MSGLTPPDIRATIRKILERLDRLERRLAKLARSKGVIDIPFTLDGPLTLTTSPPYYLAEPGGTTFEVLASLRVAGITSSTVIVTKNGNTIATIVLAANSTFQMEDVTSDFVGNQDRMNVAVTVVGNGAEGLDVQVRAKVAT